MRQIGIPVDREADILEEVNLPAQPQATTPTISLNGQQILIYISRKEPLSPKDYIVIRRKR
jgi:hypothetical protein